MKKIEGTPVIFIHGLWLHASSWKNWIELFRKAGYEPLAPGWPGERGTIADTRQHPECVAGKGINVVTDHFADIIRTLDSQPILIGHSFGGLIVQKLLDQGLGVAGVAIDAAQIKNVWPLPFAQLKSGFPVLKNPANIQSAVALTPNEFRYGFTNAISAKESEELYNKWTIPSPGKPLFEAAFGNFNPNAPTKVNTRNAKRGPLLLIAGGKDNTVPPIITRTTYKLYSKSPAVTDLKEFPDRGHSLGIDSGWKEIADYSLAWLKRQKLQK